MGRKRISVRCFPPNCYLEKYAARIAELSDLIRERIKLDREIERVQRRVDKKLGIFGADCFPAPTWADKAAAVLKEW
jgi:hypothetical protein